MHHIFLSLGELKDLAYRRAKRELDARKSQVQRAFRNIKAEKRKQRLKRIERSEQEPSLLDIKFPRNVVENTAIAVKSFVSTYIAAQQFIENALIPPGIDLAKDFKTKVEMVSKDVADHIKKEADTLVDAFQTKAIDEKQLKEKALQAGIIFRQDFKTYAISDERLEQLNLSFNCAKGCRAIIVFQRVAQPESLALNSFRSAFSAPVYAHH